VWDAVWDAKNQESERCPDCGALAVASASAPPFLPDQYGVPVARFSPTSAGPPIAPEPYLPLTTSEDESPWSARAQRPSARLRIMLPQPSPRRLRLPIGLTVLLAVLVLAGLAAGVIARDDGLDLQLFLPPASQVQPTDPPPTATPACLIGTISPDAAAVLSQATLTTGLRDPAAQDYRPVDSVTAFQAGQRAYITFQIATTQAGIAGVTFCTPAGQIPGILEIPAHSNGHYAQFSLPLDAATAGPCVVTLTWNGAVAASLPFTIVA
jgi:hypothetical protein